MFAAVPSVTQKSPPDDDLWEKKYYKWQDEIESRRICPIDVGERRELTPEEYSALANLPDTVHLTQVRSGSEPDMRFAGHLGERSVVDQDVDRECSSGTFSSYSDTEVFVASS
jgi:hypothetical protein